MRKKIFKYTLVVTDQQRVRMPDGAEILHVGEQNGLITIWALVLPEAQIVHRRIEIFGTGHSIVVNCKRNYLGTVVMSGGYVWHVFERV